MHDPDVTSLRSRPPRMMVQVPRLANPAYLLEIEAIAILAT
jgi:enamine deaminase RidA (YjgF/YER057c/UK114 family)